MPLLRKIKTAFGNIHITRDGDGSVTYAQNGCYHSQIDKDGVSRCAYIHIMHELALQSGARDVLIIGCGGGSLATMLRRKKCKVTMVDINGVAFDIARDYFKLPRDVKCVTGDGVAYLKRTPHRYDAIIIDVFDMNNKVPDCFTAKALFRLVKKSLTQDGIMVMNVITKNNRDKRADKIADNVKAAGLPVRLYDWPGEDMRNTLIMGGGKPSYTIPSGREPEEIEEDLEGLVCRRLG